MILGGKPVQGQLAWQCLAVATYLVPRARHRHIVLGRIK